jgi:hypothetical protein
LKACGFHSHSFSLLSLNLSRKQFSLATEIISKFS